MKTPQYSKIKETVRKTNSISIQSVSIAGEGAKGLFSIITLLTFLHKSIVNDTYHPFIFQYYIGVSIGSILIDIILKTQFLYEIHGRTIALSYLDAIFDFLVFDNIRKVFFDTGGYIPVTGYNFVSILQNLVVGGSFFKRDALTRVLLGTHHDFKFDNSANYFTSNEFYKWMRPKLNNVFYICYSAQQLKMMIYTGNTNRYLSNTNYVEYELLTPDNYLHAIICSSSIPLIYPIETVKGVKYCTDGALAGLNLMWIMHLLINSTYYFSDYVIYKPLLDFFEIRPETNDNFLIMHNKINIQYLYEEIIQFPELNDVELIKSVQILFSKSTLVSYNTLFNIPLTSLFLTQPFICEYSNGNMNNIVFNAYKQRKDNILNNLDKLVHVKDMYTDVPLYKVSKKRYKMLYKHRFSSYRTYLKQYEKLKVYTSNQVISTYLYRYNITEQIQLTDKKNKVLKDESGKPVVFNLNVVYFDMSVRDMYKFIDNYELYLLFHIKYKCEENIRNQLKLSIISGNMLYDITQNQQFTTKNPEEIKNAKLSENILNINDILENDVNNFLGPKQT
jgi:hypothetical protein